VRQVAPNHALQRLKSSLSPLWFFLWVFPAMLMLRSDFALKLGVGWTHLLQINKKQIMLCLIYMLAHGNNGL
jgi:hypothetical protein